jgi:replicative DNA helicase
MNDSLTQGLPPHSPEAERGFVGGCLQFSDLHDDADAIGFRPEWLYTESLRMVYEAAHALASSGAPVDTFTVAERLKAAGRLEAVGGLAELSRLVDDECPTVHVGRYWLPMLRDKYQARRLVAASFEIAAAARAASTAEEVAAALELAEGHVLGIADGGQHRECDGAGLARLALAALEARMKGQRRGLPTGLRNLDRFLTGGGLHPGQVFVLAGRPSTGKSALAFTVALNVAKAGTPVGFVSLEMSGQELAERALDGLSRVPLESISPEAMPVGRDRVALETSGRTLKGLPIITDDTPGRTLSSVRSLARRWKRTRGIGLLVLDYLQLVESTGNGGKDRREQMDAVSRGLKVTAKELGLPVIALAQLNRDFDKEPGRKPRLSDLRESGAIEQDADVVGMLYTPPAEDGVPEPAEHEPREVRLFLAKQRNGPRGVDARLLFRPTMTLYEDLSPTIDHDAK